MVKLKNNCMIGNVGARTSNLNNISPPNDFRKMNIFPNVKDLRDTKPFLRPNITEGSYDDVDHYLDVQFRLLHEDYFRPLREGILAYKNLKLQRKPITRIDGIIIHENVRLQRISNNMHGFELCFNNKKFSLVDWSQNKRFLPGSLLILSKDNFDSVHLAFVNEKECSDLKKGLVIVGFRCKSREVLTDFTYTAIESNAFFVAYQCSLSAMQTITVNNFPMAEYIVHGETRVSPPAYLTCSSSYDFHPLLGKEKHARILDYSNWPSRKVLNLELSQYNALQAALTKEFAVIQGPPGTGKSFIGLKIIQLLLHNSSLFNSRPVLVLSYTNHAVDQFMCGIAKFTDNLVRIGRGCEAEDLEPFKLDNIIEKMSSSYPPQNKLQILRNSEVIGMTTTGATIQKRTLEKVRPLVVVIEEAAEILESHFISSLPSSTQHIILIGDHQQLRPKSNVYELSTKFDMDVSLFERMVTNNMEYHQLVSQRRMRPSISSLLVPHIYKNLENHPTVYSFANVMGIKNNLLFLNHEENESSSPDSSSKCNDHEAAFIVELTIYLVLQGYSEDKITILAAYAAQTSTIEKFMKLSDRYHLCKDVRVRTIDSYQGEENDIIILSFVRSNDEGAIGFLNTSNRVCVALSRSRMGFFCLGNFALYAKKSRLWMGIVKTLVKAKSIANEMHLYCEIHDTITKVQKASDFSKVPEGGCLKFCEFKLPCGHTCPKRCHPIDLLHKQYKCIKPCDRSTCENNHKCPNLCFEKCGRCEVKLHKICVCCGSIDKVSCWKFRTAVCRRVVQIKLPCSHLAQITCQQWPKYAGQDQWSECKTCVETKYRKEKQKSTCVLF